MRRNQCFSECVPGQLYARLDFPRKQRDVPWFSMDGKNFLMLFFPQDVTVVYHILGKVTAAKCFCFQTSFRRKYQLSIGFTQNLKMSVVGISIIHNIYILKQSHQCICQVLKLLLDFVTHGRMLIERYDALFWQCDRVK